MTSPRSDPNADRRRARHLSDTGSVALAATIWVGATAPSVRPVVVLGAAALVAVVARRPLLLLIAGGLLAQGLAQHAEQGMQVSVGEPIVAELTLLSDPTPDADASRWRAEVAHDDRRWQLVVAADVTTEDFPNALAGERVAIEGTTGRLGWGSEWLRSRHVVGTIRAEQVGEVTAGSPVHRFANSLRRQLSGGAESLGPRRQALFTGFVLGDDRFQHPIDAASFQRAGLTHLLAVSGQNVAFVLALFSPVLRRMGLGWRLVLTVAVIALFALMTRFEPSVLRASVMAAVAATAVTMGREASSIRVLALTVGGLVLVDPFLVSSVGFRLSVAASGGILLLSGPIARRLRGPRPVVLALSVTAAAQLGVAPLLLATFGPVPIASVPANLLAGPASGPVMMWGMSAGLVAAFVPQLAPSIHLVTALLLGWIEWVARQVPSLLPGGLDAAHLGVVVGLVVVLGLLRSWGRVVRGVLVAAMLVVVLQPMQRSPQPVWDQQLTAGLTVWVASDGTSVVAVDGRARAERVLLALSDHRIGDVDLVVGRSPSASVRATVDAIVADRHAAVVLTADAVVEPVRMQQGCLDARVEPDRDTLRLDIEHLTGPGCEPVPGGP
ncbi:MAG TPA: ComEC/Rec2 family competence protein [Acidimicrobiales bacterium]|nr:ComEC/Rec2 family competence protein [Acidimicrobiales bacterium]